VGNSTSPEHWNFYEWTPGFEGIEKGEYSGQNGRLDAAYNLYLIEALRNSIEMGEIIGGKNIDVFKRAYQQIAGAFNSIFWNNEKRLYASFSDNGILSHYSQLVQALAIREKIVPEQHKMELCESIKHSSGLTQSELSSKLIIYESLLEASPENINYVLNDIKNVFGGMCENGATSLWEAAQGADAFEGAGSLCHGWSSVFNYLAGACLLGIKPLKPGFAEFLVRPLESYLSSVNGIVKTPAGEIEISCTKTQEEIIIKLRHPKSLIPIFDLPPKAKITVIKV
jgi:hypothetical protein